MDPTMMIGLAIGLIIAGIVLVFIEALLPSGGALGLLALVAFGGAAIAAAYVSPVFLIIVICLIPFLGLGALATGYKVLPHTRLGKLLMPDNPKPEDVTGSAAAAGLKELVGKRGVARGDLRPAGIVEIDGRRYDVVSQGGLIEPGTAVEVIEVEGNRVVVKRADVA